MADNVTADPGTGGAVFATDDIGGVHYPITKITIGALESQTLLSGGNGTTDAGTVRVTVSSDSTGVLTVDAVALDIRALTNADVVTAELSAVDNAVLDAIAASVAGTLIVDGSGVTQPVGGVAAEDAPVSGNPVLVAGRYDVVPRTLDDGDVGAIAVGVGGAVWSRQVAATVPLGDGISNTANLATDEAGDFIGTAPFNYAFNGATWDRMLGDSTDGLLVNLGSNNNVTVDGTVTVDGSAVTQPISAATLPLPTGAATSANQLPDGHNVTVDNASIAVTNGGTFVVQEDGAALTALQIIDDPVFADDAPFTLASSSVMVSGAIRDDTLGTLTAIEGDAVPLRVSSTGALHVTGGGGGTEYTLGTATYTEATSVGSIAAVVRNDGGGSLVDTDNEITSLQVDSAGALRVTGGGGGTEYTEDVATADPIVGTATLIERDDVIDTVTPIEGDWIGLRGTAEGALWTQDFNSDAILVDTGTIAADTTSIDGKIVACDTGAVVIASGTVAATQSGTWDIGTVTTVTTCSTVTNLAQLGGAAVSMNTGVRDAGTQRVTIATNDVVPASQSGTWNITNVSGTVSLPTGAATSANQATHTTALQLIDNMIVAHDAAITGATGLAAIGLNARSTSATAVQDGDAVRALATLLGKIVTYPYAIPANTWQYAAASGGITNTTGVTARAAGGAGIRNYITSVAVINGHATVSTDVQIRDGASGTVLWRGFAQAAGGGASVKFDPPLRGTANTLVEVACGTTGSATYFNLQGFVAAE